MQNLIKKEENKYFLPILFILINVYFLFLIPYSFINQYTPYFSDIAVYLNTGKEILNGRIMYTEIFDHKGPLLPLIFTIPHLFGNVDVMMTILTLLLLNTAFYLNYKTIKIFCKNNIIISIILVLELIILQLNPRLIFGPEGLALLSISYINYWILSGKYKNPTNTQLIICGILTAMMFWIKFTYITYIGMIFLFFLYTKIKEKSFNYKDILMPAIGFLIITIPLIIYLVANNALIEMFNIYFILNAKYKNTEPFSIDIKFILLLIASVWPIIYCFKKKIYEGIAISIAYITLVFFIFIMPKNNWLNLYIPFTGVPTLLSLIKININNKYIKITQKIILAILITTLIVISAMPTAQNIILSKNNFRNFYDPIIEKIEPNSKITTLYAVGNNITEKIENFNYKYFYFPMFSYDQFPEIFDTLHSDIKNKELDYIIVPIENKNIKIYKRCTNKEDTKEKIEKMNKDLYENYEIIEEVDNYILFKAKK